MIPDQMIKTIISNNGSYYRSLGYGECKQGSVIFVKVDHLKENSNIPVRCICDDCGVEFTRSLQLLNKDKKNNRCYSCSRKYVGTINGSVEHARRLGQKQVGSNHPRWVSDKKSFSEYSRKVRWLTEKNYQRLKQVINPENHKRTLCGVDGGWQLDHKISVKEGFDKRISPEEISGVDNLQMLPWSINRTKGY